ncbi:MAG: flagellar motor switch protein FliM, partial [Candidatus Methylomirabilales bacterium]
MSNILDQDQIDTLLQIVQRGVIPDMDDEKSSTPGRTILPYDFRRPNRVSKDQIRFLEILQGDLAKSLSSSLTAHLRSVIEVRPTGIAVMAHAEFFSWIAAPACLGIFSLKPLKGEGALNIDTAFVFSILDRILGGTGASSIPVREFTQIERAIVKKVLEWYLQEFQRVWSRIGSLHAELLSIETDPQLVHIVSPNEPVIVVSFDMKMGGASGCVRLLLPVVLIEPVLPKLTASRGLSGTQRNLRQESSSGVEAGLSKASLELRAILGRIPMSVRDIAQLQVGEMLRLQTGPGGRAVVEVEGVPKFRGEPGLIKGNRAVQITALASNGGSGDGRET